MAESEQKLCINEEYPEKVKLIWEKFDVKYPFEGKLYTFRKIIKHTNGQIGVLLNEINNPDVSLDEMGRKGYSMEPSFNLKRFQNLDQTEITEEQALEAKRSSKRQKELVKPLNKPYEE